MKIRLLFLAGILFLSNSFPQNNASSFSLRQCLVNGLESSQSIIKSRHEASRLRYQENESIGKLFPQVEGFVTYDNYFKTPVEMVPGEIFGQQGTIIPISLYVKHNITAGFKATQILYDQTAFTAVSISNKLKELSELKYENARTGLIYDVTSLYMLIKTTEGQISIYNENSGRMDSLLKITEAKYREGLVQHVEVERVNVDIINLITETDNLNILLSNQKNLLKHIIGMPVKYFEDGQSFTLSDSLQHSLLPANYNLQNYFNNENDIIASVENRSELQLLKREIDIARMKKQLTVYSYLPALSLYGQYYVSGQREEFDFFKGNDKKWYDVSVMGLNLSVPVFDGLQKNARADQAEIDIKEALNNYEFTGRQYNIELSDVIKKYNISSLAVQRQMQNAELAEKVYAQTLSRYKEGIDDLGDLLGVENSLSNVRLSLLNSIYQLRIAELDILKSSGKLTEIIQ